MKAHQISLFYKKLQHYEREKRTQFIRYGINEWTKSRFEVIVTSNGPIKNWIKINWELKF